MAKVVDFTAIHHARTATARSIANFLWFYRFQLSMLEPNSPEALEVENDPHHIALHNEVRRRLRLNDPEIKELYG